MQKQSIAGNLVSTSRNGWIQFAGIMTIITGGLNALDGLVAFYRTSYFSQVFVFGDLRSWSVVWMAFGAVQLASGFAILARQGWGRWFGIVTVSVNAFIQLFTISSYPLWAAVIIAYDVAIFYALSARWDRRTTAF